MAIQQYTTAIELTLRQNHIAHFNRGMAYENNNDFDNAAADYHRAIELSPEWVLPQLRLERLQRKTGEKHLKNLSVGSSTSTPVAIPVKPICHSRETNLPFP